MEPLLLFDNFTLEITHGKLYIRSPHGKAVMMAVGEGDDVTAFYESVRQAQGHLNTYAQQERIRKAVAIVARKVKKAKPHGG